jgi:hypothetical protein
VFAKRTHHGLSHVPEEMLRKTSGRFSRTARHIPATDSITARRE